MSQSETKLELPKGMKNISTDALFALDQLSLKSEIPRKFHSWSTI